MSGPLAARLLGPVLNRVHSARVLERRVVRLADLLVSYLPMNASVLDVGCGDGLLAARLLQLRPDLTIRGLDVLVREGTPITATAFDGVSLPVGDQSVDVVLMVDVLHHATEPVRLLAEARRVARTAVVIKDHLREGFGANATLRFMDWVGNARYGVALPYTYWSFQEWADMYAAALLVPTRLEVDLHLYPGLAHGFFDRQLHSLVRLAPRHSAGCD
jgi:SAM-dependent methyltransferase